MATIWIGTSGWVYKHWIGRFYPPELRQRDWLPFFAKRFPTVEINRSFYRQPTRQNFETWAAQTSDKPEFFFAVKATRLITHMKKLNDVDEALGVMLHASEGLGSKLGPFLYQFPPHWRANPERLRYFVSTLPNHHRSAFEFRDHSWFQPEVYQILSEAGCALVRAIGGWYTPMEVPDIGPFRYLRVHGGQWGIGLTDGELSYWADRLTGDAAAGQDVYIYFNNDPDGHALYDAWCLRDMLGARSAPVAWF